MGIAVFIFNILVGLSGQIRAPAAIATGKYYAVDLVLIGGYVGLQRHSGSFSEDRNMLLLS